MKKQSALDANPQLKQNPFTVPDGYFEGLEEKLVQLSKEKPIKTVKTVQLVWIRRLAAAATIAAVIAVSWLLNQKSASESISSDDIIALTAGGYLPYNELTLLEEIDDADLDNMVIETDDLIEYYEYTQPRLIQAYYITTEEI